ncbi:hypothetical protein C8R45DRAFT_1091808 [Mycena sanguinolenta]|nr:hypothetical protein C8R45DRAFT_1091808 [Mycena sanguinolenta]
MASTFTITLPQPPVPPNDLADLLRSSAPINGVEFSHTTAYIDELRSQVGMLDTAIASLQLRRSELQQSIKTHKAILSPIRRLPPEIIGEIFSLVVHATFCVHVRPPVTEHAPWVFTRVCRHWSAVALATPALWSTIFVDLDRVGHGRELPLTKLCLARSKSAPLTVHIFHERGGYNSHLAEVLDTVLDLSDRWKTVNLHIISSFHATCQLLRQLTSIRNLSNLRTLLISIPLYTTGEDTVFDAAFWDIFAFTPQLRSLEALAWDARHWLRTPFSLPWHQLTRVRTTFTSNAEALSTLRGLALIVECKFAFQRIEVLPVDSRTIPLPYLHSLVLQVETETHDPVVIYQPHTSLLDFLETPCLQNLTTHETADEDAVLGLITRSNCAVSLTSFRFHLSSINNSMILQVLRKMPHLTSLTLEDFDGTLLPRSSVPEFVQAFSKQWLVMQAAFPSRQSLRVLIVDEDFSEGEAHDLTRMLETMHQDDLFITVSAYAHSPNIISDDFHY